MIYLHNYLTVLTSNVLIKNLIFDMYTVHDASGMSFNVVILI